MKKFIAGLIVGTVISGNLNAQSGLDIISFTDVKEILGFNSRSENFSDAYRLGYVAGIADAYAFITYYFSERKDTTVEEDFDDVMKIFSCLRTRSSSLGTLESFASDIWRDAAKIEKGKDVSAASVLSFYCLPMRSR